MWLSLHTLLSVSPTLSLSTLFRSLFHRSHNSISILSNPHNSLPLSLAPEPSPSAVSLLFFADLSPLCVTQRKWLRLWVRWYSMVRVTMSPTWLSAYKQHVITLHVSRSSVVRYRWTVVCNDTSFSPTLPTNFTATSLSPHSTSFPPPPLHNLFIVYTTWYSHCKFCVWASTNPAYVIGVLQPCMNVNVRFSHSPPSIHHYSSNLPPM